MSWRDVPGWSSDIEVWYPKLAAMLPDGGTFIEVGVLFGRSLCLMAELRPDLRIWAVDSWEDGDRGEHEPYCRKYGSTFDAFLGGVKEHCPGVLERIHVIRALSTSVTLPMADAAFLDADHEFAGIQADIAHYTPRVRDGGIICGHDYGEHFPGVKRAVDEAFGGKHHMGPGGWTSVWWLVKP